MFSLLGGLCYAINPQMYVASYYKYIKFFFTNLHENLFNIFDFIVHQCNDS